MSTNEANPCCCHWAGSNRWPRHINESTEGYSKFFLMLSWLDHWQMILLWWDPECQLFLFQRDFADIPPCHNGYNSALVVTELLGSEFTGISGSEADQDPKGALCQGPGVWPKAAARCWWTRRGLRAPRRSAKTQETLLRHKISFANSPERKNRRISWWKQSFQWVNRSRVSYLWMSISVQYDQNL